MSSNTSSSDTLGNNTARNLFDDIFLPYSTKKEKSSNDTPISKCEETFVDLTGFDDEPTSPIILENSGSVEDPYGLPPTLFKEEIHSLDNDSHKDHMEVDYVSLASSDDTYRMVDDFFVPLDYGDFSVTADSDRSDAPESQIESITEMDTFLQSGGHSKPAMVPAIETPIDSLMGGKVVNLHGFREEDEMNVTLLEKRGVLSGNHDLFDEDANRTLESDPIFPQSGDTSSTPPSLITVKGISQLACNLDRFLDTSEKEQKENSSMVACDDEFEDLMNTLIESPESEKAEGSELQWLDLRPSDESWKKSSQLQPSNYHDYKRSLNLPKALVEGLKMPQVVPEQNEVEERCPQHIMMDPEPDNKGRKRKKTVTKSQLRKRIEGITYKTPQSVCSKPSSVTSLDAENAEEDSLPIYKVKSHSHSEESATLKPLRIVLSKISLTPSTRPASPVSTDSTSNSSFAKQQKQKNKRPSPCEDKEVKSQIQKHQPLPAQELSKNNQKTPKLMTEIMNTSGYIADQKYNSNIREQRALAGLIANLEKPDAKRRRSTKDRAANIYSEADNSSISSYKVNSLIDSATTDNVASTTGKIKIRKKRRGSRKPYTMSKHSSLNVVQSQVDSDSTFAAPSPGDTVIQSRRGRPKMCGWTPAAQQIRSKYTRPTLPRLTATKVKNGHRQKRGHYGWTPLHIAANAGNETELLSCLRDDPDSVDMRDSVGKTPLLLAAAAGRLAAVRYLLDAGADVNAACMDNGFRPLHEAVAGDAPIEVIRLLLERGANPEYTLYSGHTLEELATNEEMLRFIKRHCGTFESEGDADEDFEFDLRRSCFPFIFTLKPEDPDEEYTEYLFAEDMAKALKISCPLLMSRFGSKLTLREIQGESLRVRMMRPADELPLPQDSSDCSDFVIIQFDDEVRDLLLTSRISVSMAEANKEERLALCHNFVGDSESDVEISLVPTNDDTVSPTVVLTETSQEKESLASTTTDEDLQSNSTENECSNYSSSPKKKWIVSPKKRRRYSPASIRQVASPDNLAKASYSSATMRIESVLSKTLQSVPASIGQPDHAYARGKRSTSVNRLNISDWKQSLIQSGYKLRDSLTAVEKYLTVINTNDHKHSIRLLLLACKDRRGSIDRYVGDLQHWITEWSTKIGSDTISADKKEIILVMLKEHKKRIFACKSAMKILEDSLKIAEKILDKSSLLRKLEFLLSCTTNEIQDMKTQIYMFQSNVDIEILGWGNLDSSSDIDVSHSQTYPPAKCTVSNGRDDIELLGANLQSTSTEKRSINANVSTGEIREMHSKMCGGCSTCRTIRRIEERNPDISGPRKRSSNSSSKQLDDFEHFNTYRESSSSDKRPNHHNSDNYHNCNANIREGEHDNSGVDCSTSRIIRGIEERKPEFGSLEMAVKRARKSNPAQPSIPYSSRKSNLLSAVQPTASYLKTYYVRGGFGGKPPSLHIPVNNESSLTPKTITTPCASQNILIKRTSGTPATLALNNRSKVIISSISPNKPTSAVPLNATRIFPLVTQLNSSSSTAQSMSIKWSNPQLPQHGVSLKPGIIVHPRPSVNRSLTSVPLRQMTGLSHPSKESMAFIDLTDHVDGDPDSSDTDVTYYKY